MHYKFSKQDFENFHTIANNQHDARGRLAIQYAEWYKENYDRNLLNKTSIRYTSPDDFIQAGFLKTIDWNEKFREHAMLTVSLNNLLNKPTLRRMMKRATWRLREMCWSPNV